MKMQEKQVDNSEKNMRNPDFLWEIPKDEEQQYPVRDLQQGNRSVDNTGCDTNSESCS
jgi:hypothetical protein